MDEGVVTVGDTRVHSTRRYNYRLDGKDNFAVDREPGDLIAAAFPGVRITARENWCAVTCRAGPGLPGAATSTGGWPTSSASFRRGPA
ncbi:SAM-dependent methyltransferase [Actinoplanes sp. NPDC048796]|uniref:SAM-dependent methyltransferase n=1 Tax=Actinoplanes sp. NPDC048796 TaxID=3155640 RepID=UPI0033C0DB88